MTGPLAVPLLVATLVFAQTSSPVRHAPPTTAGIVVDSGGGAVVHALVRLRDPAGHDLAQDLTDDRGRFDLAAPPCDGCTVDATLAGFEPASRAAGPGLTRLVLRPAPIHESVVVSATRDAASSGEVGASVTVFDAADIDRRAVPLVGDLLRATPGVTLVSTGGLGGQTSLFVRGGESSYNKVLLDGIPLNEPGGTFNFNSLTTVNLDRVEVVRGAQSALFGSDAMSSVIQLFTRRGQPGRPRFSGSVETGSYRTRTATGAVSGGAGRTDYTFAVSRARSDNRGPNAAFGDTTLSWNAGHAFGRTAVRLVGRADLERNGSPGPTAFGRADLDAFFRRRDITTGITVDRETARFRQRATYAYARSAQASTNLVADPPFVPAYGARQAPFAFTDYLFNDHTVLTRHYASYQADWRFDQGSRVPLVQLVTAAVDLDGERATLADRLGGTVLPAARNNVGATAEYQVLTARLALAASVRLEHNASFGSATVPRLSASYQARTGHGFWSETRLKFNAGLGVKEPTIVQSFSLNPYYLGNPDLRPERSRTVDLGVEQRMAGGRAKATVTWFDSAYRNQISTRTTDPTTFEAEYFNIGRTRARGVEAELAMAPWRGWQARAGYTWLASRVLASTSEFSPVFAVGQWAFRRPRNSGFANVDWRAGRADVGVFGLFTGRRVDSDFSSLEPPLTEAAAYALWSATVRYRFRTSLDSILRIENLTNADYMQPLGYPAWGRTVHVGLRMGF